MAVFRLRQGYDVPIAGAPATDVVTAPQPRTVAVQPGEFRGIKARLLVTEGDRVKAGTPLFHAKRNEAQVFTAPVSGKVSELHGIVRGAKRALLSIVIEVDQEDAHETFDSYSAGELATLDREKALSQLLQSGLLAAFRQRPFGHVANPEQLPRDIFVSAIETAPLAADPNIIVAGNEDAFQAGLDVLTRLTDGKVHLATDGARSDQSQAFSGARNVEVHRFSGKHPAGVVGVHIHHIAPIRHRDDVVWTISVQGVIMVGRLFLEGRVNARTVVALGGTSATERKHYQTVVGASAASIVQSNVADEEIRWISGDVLTGKKIEPNGHVGFYENTLTLMPESVSSDFMGWMLPGHDKPSRYRTIVSAFMKGVRFRMDTKVNGGHRAFFATGAYESVLPMKILPMFLFKSIMAEDIEEMQGLGLLEITEEEVALCEYICPSKTEIQKLVRDGLELVCRETAPAHGE
jgi:Na+-transporting NADH:ubiquinone oxidoreductase subunit A